MTAPDRTTRRSITSARLPLAGRLLLVGLLSFGLSGLLHAAEPECPEPEACLEAALAAREEQGELAALEWLDALIAAHPKGVELPISEGGRGLSGGQRTIAGLTRLQLYDLGFAGRNKSLEMLGCHIPGTDDGHFQYLAHYQAQLKVFCFGSESSTAVNAALASPET